MNLPYKLDQKRFTRNKRSSLLGLVITYEENERLCIQPLGESQHLIFFATLEWVQ
jgi:hypothetical protein